MLAAAASRDAFARSHFWRLCGPKKIKHLTFHDKTFQRIAWTCSLLRAVELGIYKESRQGLGLLWSLTRKVEKETHVANTLIITLIIALGKHPDHHTEFACLAAASRDAFARSHFWRLCGPKKIKHLTFHDKTFQRIAWTCSLLRGVELGICKESRQGLGLLWSLTRKVEKETHVANTLIITLIIALGKHPDHHTEFVCLLQLPFWLGPARPLVSLVSARCISCCFWSSPVCLNEMT